MKLFKFSIRYKIIIYIIYSFKEIILIYKLFIYFKIKKFLEFEYMFIYNYL